MYNEIYTGILHLLTDPYEVKETKDNEDLSRLVSITLNRTMIVEGYRNINISEVIPIILIYMEFDEPTSIYDDIVVYKGKLTQIVAINKLAYEEGDTTEKVMSVLIPMKCIMGKLINANIAYLKDKSISATDVIYYAPLIIGVRLLTHLFKITDPSEMIDYIKALYPASKSNMISIDTIKSAINVNRSFQIKDLLDNSYLLAASEDVYKDLFFANPKMENNTEEVKDGEGI